MGTEIFEKYLEAIKEDIQHRKYSTKLVVWDHIKNKKRQFFGIENQVREKKASKGI